MDNTIFVAIVLMKAASTLFLLATPWLAWRKGFAGRAVILTFIALGFSTLAWWPAPDQPSQIMAQIETQMLWFSVVVVALAPLAFQFHRVEKSVN
ncbi:hypothetical protein [Marinobacter salicampi]|uniref:hypothetical protein n=1 Tax=Marinobacter salicampi TaxID=435907 RepID=UPI001407667B|nr:hypothetical protein [Marinobacter salicampi]